MGISKVTGIAATALLVSSLALRQAGVRAAATAPILATSCVAYVVTVASHTAVNVPWILGKTPSGRFPLWSSVLFGPFLMLARTYAKVKRFLRKENVYDEIAQGLYLGGWPFMAKHLPPGDPSVVDCTCELPRSSFVKVDEYVCLATWDTRAPLPSQIEFAARWACEKRAQGKPVYVHCAFGKQ
uniref:Tyrosine specific protein phosphatases domain-containing protein n=1 Tax=Aegilops tauschii subsp. strangulata TaxID=200361 RepID=A0A453HRZ2_AEGTS